MLNNAFFLNLKGSCIFFCNINYYYYYYYYYYYFYYLEFVVQGRERVRTLYQSKDPKPTQPTHGRKKKKIK